MIYIYIYNISYLHICSPPAPGYVSGWPTNGLRLSKNMKKQRVPLTPRSRCGKYLQKPPQPRIHAKVANSCKHQGGKFLRPAFSVQNHLEEIQVDGYRLDTV